MADFGLSRETVNDEYDVKKVGAGLSNSTLGRPDNQAGAYIHVHTRLFCLRLELVKVA